jgi:hypothetical protein
MEKISSCVLLLDSGNIGASNREKINNYCSHNNYRLSTLILKNSIKEDIEDALKYLLGAGYNTLIILYFGSENTRVIHSLDNQIFIKFEEIKGLIKEYFPNAIFRYDLEDI